MREKQWEKVIKGEEREREREMKPSEKKPNQGLAPPPLQPLSIVWNTGFHMVVLT